MEFQQIPDLIIFVCVLNFLHSYLVKHFMPEYIWMSFIDEFY